MRNSTRGDKQVEQHAQIADPKAEADPGGVNESRAERFEIVRLVRQRRKRGR